ncbi:MAG: TetR/AcrR family transcriptional regulator [Nocardioides sp.]
MELSNQPPGAGARAPGTAQRLRRAAARLLSERTWHEITLRDITNAADANVASVNYHFGSKNALLAEVVHNAVAGVVRRRAAIMDALPADASLETVVEVWLEPGLVADSPDSPQREPSWEILRRHLGSSVPEVAQAYEEAGVVIERSLTSRLRHLLPHLGDHELRLRHVGILAAVAALTDRHLASEMPGLKIHTPDQPTDPESLRRAVIAFACGALRAPATQHRP